MKPSIAALSLLLALGAPAATAQAPAPASQAPAPASQAPARAQLAPLDEDLAGQISQEGVYALRPGQTLKEAFAEWARNAGYSLVWRAPIDLPIEAAVNFPPGTRFADAVRQTLGAFWHSKHAVVGRLYKNRVLVISGRDA